jgi:hypothetical protein
MVLKSRDLRTHNYTELRIFLGIKERKILHGEDDFIYLEFYNVLSQSFSS